MRQFFSFVLLAVTVVTAKTYLVTDVAKLDTATMAYLVLKPIEIASNDTLFIQKGVKLAFSRFAGIELKGCLQALGTADNEVILTSKADLKAQGEEGQWDGIKMYPSSHLELRNVRISFSTSGITSCCDNIILDRVIFRQNENWHLSIGERVITVAENIPFSHPDLSPVVIPAATIVNKQPSLEKIQNKIYIPKRTFVITPLVIATGIVGGIFINKYLNSQSKYDNYKSGNVSFNTASSTQRKEKFNQLKSDLYVNGAVGFTLAALSAAGLAYVIVFTINY